jgi:hypothetical protein
MIGESDMQSYIKVFPKHMELHNVGGHVSVKLRYCVEQYGLMTGPFELRADFQPEVQKSETDPWVVKSNSCPRYNEFFKRFFSYLDAYIQKYHDSCPFDDVLLGKIRFYEIYFPKIHCKCTNASQTRLDLNALFFKERSGLTLPMALAVSPMPC